MYLLKKEVGQNVRKGSITVFMSLLLMVIASLLFTLLEGSRYLMLGMAAILNSRNVTESVFAEYNVPAYQNYHLFMMDGGYGGGQLQLSKINAKMQELGQENLNPSVSGFGKYQNFLQMDVTDSSVVRYELATDQNSSALLKQMSETIKGEMGADLLQQAASAGKDITESWDKGDEADDYLDEAFDAIEKEKEAVNDSEQSAAKSAGAGAESVAQGDGNQQQNRAESLTGNTDVDTEVENPMEDVKSAKSSPILSQVLADGSGISVKEIQKEDAIMKRTLNIGNYRKSYTGGIVDKLLVIRYLKKYTSNYVCKTNMPHALAYEQEYILFGKYTDEKNLEKMAKRLLLLREGINFAHLLSDSAKRSEALAMATSIAAAMAIPAAVTAIQMGLLASWAYAESIVELRTLFSGGKVATVKTSMNWNVSLSETATVLFDSSRKAKEVSNGQDYEDYLQAFLAVENIKSIGQRFANLLEKNLRLYPGYEQVKLDCMMTAMETSHVYQAEQTFLTFVTIADLSKKGYCYNETYEFSYYAAQ